MKYLFGRLYPYLLSPDPAVEDPGEGGGVEAGEGEEGGTPADPIEDTAEGGEAKPYEQPSKDTEKIVETVIEDGVEKITIDLSEPRERKIKKPKKSKPKRPPKPKSCPDCIWNGKDWVKPEVRKDTFIQTSSDGERSVLPSPSRSLY